MKVKKEVIESIIDQTLGEDHMEGWELLRQEITGEWRWGNRYRIIIRHPEHGLFGYNYKDQHDGEYSSVEGEPDEIEVYPVEEHKVVVTEYRRTGQ